MEKILFPLLANLHQLQALELTAGIVGLDLKYFPQRSEIFEIIIDEREEIGLDNAISFAQLILSTSSECPVAAQFVQELVGRLG